MKKRIVASTWAEIRTAYASGIGLRELARNRGIPAGTVLARAHRKKWTQRNQDAKALATVPQSPAISASEFTALSMHQRGERHVARMARVVERVGPHVESIQPGAILDRIDDIEKLDKVARRTFGIEDMERGQCIVNIALSGIEPVPYIDVAAEA